MLQDFPQKITAKTQVKFKISESGLYAISIAARCDKNDDFRIEVDDQFFREILPEKNIQKFDIPPAWNGPKKEQKIITRDLSKGIHYIEF